MNTSWPWGAMAGNNKKVQDFCSQPRRHRRGRPRQLPSGVFSMLTRAGLASFQAATDNPSMAVLNRCAIAVAPRQPMVDWTRPFWTREDMEGLGDDHSLYLIPTYDSELEAQDRLLDSYGQIFSAELELWCRDRSRWPQPRSLELFEAWFTVRFFPLVEDLDSEPLHTYVIDDDLQDALREALG